MNPGLRDLVRLLAERAYADLKEGRPPESGTLTENPTPEAHARRPVQPVLDRPAIRLVPR